MSKKSPEIFDSAKSALPSNASSSSSDPMVPVPSPRPKAPDSRQQTTAVSEARTSPPASGSESRPQAQKAAGESQDYSKKMLDSKPGLQKSSDSKGGNVKMPDSKTGAPKASELRTRMTSDSKPGVRKSPDSKAKTSASKSGSSKRSESKADNPQTSDSSKRSESKADNLQTSDTKSDSSKSSDSNSDITKFSSDSKSDISRASESKSNISRTTDSRSGMISTSDSKPRIPNAADSKPHLPDSKPHIPDSTLQVPKDSDSGLCISNLFRPFATAMNFLKTRTSLFSPKTPRLSTQTTQATTKTHKDAESTSTSSNSFTVGSTPTPGVAPGTTKHQKTTSQLETRGTASSKPSSTPDSTSAVTMKRRMSTSSDAPSDKVTFESMPEPRSKPMGFLSANPASGQPGPSRSRTTAEDKPRPLPERFAWSRASYSAAPTQMLYTPKEPPDSASVSAMDPLKSSLRKPETRAKDQPINWGPTDDNIVHSVWLADPAPLGNPVHEQPVSDAQEAGLVSPQITSLMSMNTRRRGSVTSGSGRRKSTASHRSDDEKSRSRSTSRNGRTESGSGRQKKQISFQDRADPDEPFPATNFVAWDVETPIALYMANTGPLAQKPITVMSVLRQAAFKHPKRTAYGIKENGEWRTITYQQLLETVYQVAKGFIKLGLERYNIVGILGQNSPEWVISHLAVIFAGGISAPMHVMNEDEDSMIYAKQIKCRIIVVGSAKEMRRILVFRGRLPNLLAIVQHSKEHFQKTEDVYSWNELLGLGHDVSFEVLHERTMQQAPNICCSIIQTAGIAAPPKTVLLSHDNVTWGSNALGRNLSLSDGNGVTVSFMPLSCIIAQVMDIYIPICFGTTVYFAPSTAITSSVVNIVREIRPTLFCGAHRLYNTLRAVTEASWSRNAVSRLLKKWAIKRGLHGYKARLLNRPMSLGWRMANAVVFKRIRKQFGLGRCRELLLAGESERKEVWKFYYGLNMDLLMFYGMTESTGQHTMSLDDRHRMKSVGLEMDGCTTMIDRANDEGIGEFLIKGRNVAMGYLDMKEKTLASFTDDGWFRTGDLGKRDEDGFLFVVGRLDHPFVYGRDDPFFSD